MKINHFPNVDGIPLNGFSIEQGGTFGLEGITPEVLGKPNGVAVSTSLNLINPINLDTSFVVSSPGVDGPVTGVETKTATFIITNYNFNKTYTVTTNDGAVSIDRETVTFTPSHFGDTSFKINDRVINFPVQQLIVTKPSIIAPVVNTGLLNTVTVQSSAFDTGAFVDTHSSSDWELSLVSDFSTILQSLSLSSTSKTTWNIVGLEMAKVYYVRVKHRGNLLAPSPWSEPYSLKTEIYGGVIAPTILSPVNNGLDVSITPVGSVSTFTTSGWPGTLTSKEWELSTTSTFLAASTTKFLNSDTFSTLLHETTYYLRARYSASTGTSPWSSVVIFKTLKQPVSYNPPVITSPTAANVTTLLSYKAGFSPFFAASYSLPLGFETNVPVGQEWHIYLAQTSTLVLSTPISFNGEIEIKYPHAAYFYYLTSNLLTSTNYFVQMRHKLKDGSVTPWSEKSYFFTYSNQQQANLEAGLDINGAPTSTTPTTPTTTPGVVVPSTVAFYASGGSNVVPEASGGYTTNVVMKYYTPTSGTKSYSYSYTYSGENGGGGSGSAGGSGPAGASDTAYSNFMLIFSTTIPGRGVVMTMDNGQTFNF